MKDSEWKPLSCINPFVIFEIALIEWNIEANEIIHYL